MLFTCVWCKWPSGQFEPVFPVWWWFWEFVFLYVLLCYNVSDDEDAWSLCTQSAGCFLTVSFLWRLQMFSNSKTQNSIWSIGALTLWETNFRTTKRMKTGSRSYHLWDVSERKWSERHDAVIMSHTRLSVQAEDTKKKKQGHTHTHTQKMDHLMDVYLKRK